MIMQRKDLAKEFSLIVQQEIKNHNDSILATNMALEDLKRQIRELSAKTALTSAELASDISDQNSSISVIQENLQKSLDKHRKDIADAASQHLTILKSMKKSLDERETYFLTLEGFSEFERKIDQGLAILKVSVNQSQSCSQEEIREMWKKWNILFEEMKREFSEELCKHIEEIMLLNRTLDQFGVNFSGQTREIELLKKRCFVVEKNIENLYTQIERLKAGKA